MFVHPVFWSFEGWSHGDKRIGELTGPALFQFNRERVLRIGKTRATGKPYYLGGINDFIYH